MSRRLLDRRRAFWALLAVTVVALLARVFALGFRVFHWDEARVGYWTLRYLETGVWEYRAIMHGPLLFHLNKHLFGSVGTADFIARIPVALVGGLLPLVAWLFRERLRNVEMVILGGFLALNPILLYYSRFMRNDVLVAAFGLLAFGLFVRLADTGNERYLYAGVAALALGFATKEIVVVYLAVWVGATALLVDHRLFAARAREERWQTLGKEYLTRMYRLLRAYWLPVAIAVVEFLVIIVIFYAPRPELYHALGNPGQLPGVIDAATLESWQKLQDLWISGGHEHSYVAFFMDALEITATTALPLSAFAVLGFVVDRYSGEEPRDVVAFGFYWGFVTFLIYPAITDISSAWSLVHAMVPLAIPAAVGLRLIVDHGVLAHDSDDWVGVGLAALVVLAVVAQVGVTAIETSYRTPQDDSNPLVQYGQPAGYLHPTLSDVETIAGHNEGTDVLFYGDHFYVSNESVKDQFPAVPDWLNRLPLSWYLERGNATVTSTKDISTVTGETPVIIARAEHYGELNPKLSGYEAYTYEITSSGTETVFFIDESALQDAESGSDG